MMVITVMITVIGLKENEIVKELLPVDGQQNSKKYVPLDKFNLLSGKTFKATFYNENKITYNVAQTYLHPKNVNGRWH